MTKPKNKIVNTNFTSKVKDKILNNYDQSPVDKLTGLLQKVKAQHQELKKGEYFGWCLFSTRRTVPEFAEMFPEDSAFFKELINLAGKNSASISGHFVESRVQVPELTGMLPMPDFGILTNRTRLIENKKDAQRDEDSKKVEQVTEKIKKSEQDALKEVLKMNLYPRAYYYSEDNSVTDRGRLCKIKFSDSLPTKGIAILLDEMDDYFEIEFDT